MEQRKMSEEKKAKNEWVHFRELRARCPVCKKVAHVACKNGTYFFVHDARLQGTTQWRPPSQYLRFSLTGS